MQKFSFIFQSFFKLLLIFLLAFVWVRFFVKSLVKSIIISSVVTLVIEIISQFFFKKHTQKVNLKAKEKEDAEDMFTSLDPVIFLLLDYLYKSPKVGGEKSSYTKIVYAGLFIQ